MELCTDRTLSDVEELQALSDCISKYGVDDLTAEEQQLWFHGDGSVVLTADLENIIFTDGILKLAPVVIRGAYNTADLERVDGANLLVISMHVYAGINSTARRVDKMYIGINGKARKVTKGYIGDANGKARLLF